MMIFFWEYLTACVTAHKKMKFFVKDFLGKCDQVLRKLRIWSHLLKKSLMKNFMFCTVCEALPLAGTIAGDSHCLKYLIRQE